MDSQAAQTAQNPELVKGLGLTSATTLVMGSMIGSGIFIVSADIARMTDSPALLIAAWVVTGFMTITGALCYGELAAMMPKAGGQYVFTIAKVGSLALLIVVAIFVGANSHAMAQNFGDFWRNASLSAIHPIDMPGGGIAFVGTLVVIAVAQTGSLFSADAWNNVTFTAAEVKNPSRNLPLALALGTGTVITLYVLANFVYLMVLPLHGDKYGFSDMARGIQYANQDRVGTAVMLQMFGATGAAAMAVAILISTFGCNNGLILSGARVYYAMAKDNLFFKSVGKLHPEYKTPVMALIIQ